MMMMSTTTTANHRPQYYNLLDAMGDFTQPEIIALVAKCSRTARDRLNPLLEIKKSDKAEMYHLITRLFPSIRDLAHHSQLVDASLYNWLLDGYFAPNQDKLPRYCEVVYRIGNIRSKCNYKFEALLQDIVPEMQTVYGRRMLLSAVDEWIKVAKRIGRMNYANRAAKNKELQFLERFKDTVLNDFAVRYCRISTVHQESDIYPWY